MQNIKDFLQGASNSIASNVSAPVDGIAWLLRKAGLPVPPNPMGGSDWMTEKGLTPQPQNRTAGLLGEFAGLAGPMVAAAKVPQIAKGLLSLDDKAMDMGRVAIEKHMVKNGMIQPATVWHGSPHKFDKFDSSKIGTGEGNQAYGHGLYLADSPAVAKGYAENLAMRDSGQTPAQIQAAIKTTMDTMQGPRRAQVLAGLRADLDMAKQSTRQGASVYKVDLPDEHIAKMLDWDKPLSAQHPDVKAALSQKLSALPDSSFSDWTQSAYRDKALRAFSDVDDVGITGSGLYKFLQAQKTGLNPNSAVGSIGQSEASSVLKDAGVPGIRYLDGGSRGAGAGSSNYVVFPGNEDLLKILERNGQGLNQAKPFVYPQDKALATAQLNAAKPLDQGGLGLLANNTPAQRAQAMGFTDDVYHGTNADIRAFNPALADSRRKTGTPGGAVVTSSNPATASTYAGQATDSFGNIAAYADGGNVIPLALQKQPGLSATAKGANWNDIFLPKYPDVESVNDFAAIAAAKGKQQATIKNVRDNATWSKQNGIDARVGDTTFLFDPAAARSRFAAFDPARRNEADLLGRADPELLKWIAGGALGYGGYNALKD